MYVKYGVDYDGPLDVVVYRNLESCIQALIDKDEINDISNDYRDNISYRTLFSEKEFEYIETILNNPYKKCNKDEELARSIFTKILKKYNEIRLGLDRGYFYYYKKIEFEK